MVRDAAGHAAEQQRFDARASARPNDDGGGLLGLREVHQGGPDVATSFDGPGGRFEAGSLSSTSTFLSYLSGLGFGVAVQFCGRLTGDFCGQGDISRRHGCLDRLPDADHVGGAAREQASGGLNGRFGAIRVVVGDENLVGHATTLWQRKATPPLGCTIRRSLAEKGYSLEVVRLSIRGPLGPSGSGLRGSNPWTTPAPPWTVQMLPQRA